MGLDMYLTKKIYVGGMWAHRQITGTINIYAGNKEIPVNLRKVSYIEEEAGYWRKANAIHKWFVDNVQDGVDDCKPYYVPYERLMELKDICRQVLRERDKNQPDEEKIKQLLPPASGFFFGSTDLDEYYYDAIEYTLEILEDIADAQDGEIVNYYYEASW